MSELLSPAANKEVAKGAILHGADAVYIGAISHGARSRAANSLEDIREVVEFAHQYRAKVYVTVNTLVYEKELDKVAKLVRDLYRTGVDAIIVQDMSLLRLDLPPIALHASTQCDTRTLEKAKFLEEVGFSQVVLARELTLPEIGKIAGGIGVPVECFIHGALCVSYSGRCAASQRATGRSANRGECAQMCRMPYTLRNARGEVLEKNKYLLSLRDFNASAHIKEMLEAGAKSFKIEGRLKESAYVNNVTAYYRQLIDRINVESGDKYPKNSFGTVEVDFIPSPEKSFNRGFTDYFLGSRRPAQMASLLTPKSQGEPITDISELRNGDGISFINARGEYEGVNVNGVTPKGLRTSRPVKIPKGSEIRRTYNIEWAKKMSGKTATRTLWVDMKIDARGITIKDERGMRVRVPLALEEEKAEKPMEPERVLGKLGGSIYRLRNLENNLPADAYIRPSELARARREGIRMLDIANKATYRFDYRQPENKEARYPGESLDSRGNVANSVAERFYADHGVRGMAKAVECGGAPENGEVMTTRYCLLRELGACKRTQSPAQARRYAEPLTITTGPNSYRLLFHCDRCEMGVAETGEK